MKPTRAIILRHSNPISHEYAAITAKSCEDIGLEWQYFNGYTNMSGRDAWVLTGINVGWPLSGEGGKKAKWLDQSEMRPEHKANCASAGHAAIWKMVAEGRDDAVIILEHDALMLQSVDIDIPDFGICVLGYKVTDPENYNHTRAGGPKRIVEINGHEGAHAYAITKQTAEYLVSEIEGSGVMGAVDNVYFIKGQRRTRAPLYLMDPTPAIGWLRESTIWTEGSANRNYKFIQSFDQNYRYGLVSRVNK